MQAYQDTVALDPHHVDAMLNFCNILLAQDNTHEEVKECYESILTIHPQYTRGIINLAALHHATSSFSEAERLYTQALQLEPGNPMATHALAAISGRTTVTATTSTTSTTSNSIHIPSKPSE
eukprot:gene53933-72072_t